MRDVELVPFCSHVVGYLKSAGSSHYEFGLVRCVKGKGTDRTKACWVSPDLSPASTDLIAIPPEIAPATRENNSWGPASAHRYFENPALADSISRNNLFFPVNLRTISFVRGTDSWGGGTNNGRAL